MTRSRRKGTSLLSPQNRILNDRLTRCEQATQYTIVGVFVEFDVMDCSPAHTPTTEGEQALDYLFFKEDYFEEYDLLPLLIPLSYNSSPVSLLVSSRKSSPVSMLVPPSYVFRLHPVPLPPLQTSSSFSASHRCLPSAPRFVLQQPSVHWML
ncbi:hypothetical protein PO909_025317 [Leuciscus waleckii]